MVDITSHIKKVIEDGNPLLKGRGEIYTDSLSFGASGINDAYRSLFYIRYLNNGARKYTVRWTDDSYVEMTTNVRLVFQITDKIDRAVALNSLLGQVMSIKGLELLNFSNDNEGIYKEETQSDKQPLMDFNLFLFDLKIYKEQWKSNLKCIPICPTLCQPSSQSSSQCED